MSRYKPVNCVDELSESSLHCAHAIAGIFRDILNMRGAYRKIVSAQCLQD
jgi:hypothetical protein